MSDINIYKKLCDMDGCGHEQCGELFEGFLVTRHGYNHIELSVRVHPCRIHLDQLRRLAIER